MKFSCKKPILNIILKTISLLILRKKKKNPQFYVPVVGLFSNQISGGKVVFTLKRFQGFSGLTQH